MKKYKINKNFYYNIFKIDDRTIYEPSLALRYFQKNIVRIVQKYYPLSISIEKCAKKHADKKWLLKMDIRHFYESIPAERIFEILSDIAQKTTLFTLEELKNTTMVDDMLPTGAVTSAHLANACMKKIDKKIELKCKKLEMDYSRYMDDMFFSADNKADLQKIEKFVRGSLAEYNMQINDDKVKYVSQNKKQIIMGLLVNKSEICLPKETKRKIRAILHQYMTGKTNNEYFVAGYLSYVLSVDKEYFKKLNNYYWAYKKKYTVDTSRIRIIGKLFNHSLRGL